jgi:hypothetical protein
VRDFLATMSAVTAFYAAPQEQGGDNVTVVELGGRGADRLAMIKLSRCVIAPISLS